MLRNPSYPGHSHATSLANGEPIRVGDCRSCGHAIGWVQSKAGKWYPCVISHAQSEEFGHTDALRARPWTPHKCRPEDIAEHQAIQAMRGA
jgi:hypothetical protein